MSKKRVRKPVMSAKNEPQIFRCTLCQRCGYEFTAHRKHFTRADDIRGPGCHFSTSEIVDTTAIIEEAECDLARYDSEIAILRNTLEALESQRSALQLYCDQNKALISPARKLPTELLLEIFTLVCTSSGSYSLEIKRDSVSTAALDLSQVCSAWRQVTRATGVLWSNLYVDLSWGANLTLSEMVISHGYSNEDPPRRFCGVSDIPYLLEFIYRPQVLDEMLTLHIVATNPYPPDYSYYDLDWVGTLHPYGWELWYSLTTVSEQWKDITIEAPLWIFDDMANHMPEGPHVGTGLELWSLERLKLNWFTQESEQLLRPQIFNFFRNAEELHTLALPELHIWFSFPFAQITRFETVVWDDFCESSECSFMDVLALLKRSHSLRELDYYCSEEPDSEWSSNIATQVSHPYLDSVKFGVVKADYDQAWLHFLNLLTLKGIHSLTVKGSSPQAVPITWVQSISQLVLRSGCQLKHLDLLNLENSFTSELDLLHLFSLIPEVTHLSFCVSCSDCTFTDLFFTSLTIATTTAEILLPNLAELSIDIREDVEGAKNTVPKSSLPRADTVVSMAESRRDQESAFDAGLIGHRRSVASLQVFTFRLTSLRYGRRLIKPKKLRWKVDTRSESRILALKEAGMGITVQGT